MQKFMNFLMQIMPFVWLILSFSSFMAGHYDRAAYDMAAGAFFMILPMYYDFLDRKR